MAEWTNFKGVSHIGRSLLLDQIESNVVSLCQFALLNLGDFVDVRIPSSGAYGGNYHSLRLANDPNYAKGRVWEAIRGNWVWESGLEFSRQPIGISGIYVNSAYKPTSTTGAFAYHINYPLGRILFDSAINPSSTITCEYSFRHYHFSTADVPWFRHIMFGSLRPDDIQWGQFGSGSWDIPGQARIQLPHVVVECPGDRTSEGYALGGGHNTFTDVLFHIYAESNWDRKQMVDVLFHQKNKLFRMFDKNLVIDNSGMPLNQYGDIKPSALMYPQLVEPPYWWRNMIWKDVRSQGQDAVLPLYMATVRTQLEILMPEL